MIYKKTWVIILNSYFLWRYW